MGRGGVVCFSILFLYLRLQNCAVPCLQQGGGVCFGFLTIIKGSLKDVELGSKLITKCLLVYLMTLKRLDVNSGFRDFGRISLFKDLFSLITLPLKLDY
jgi:hypothetical protein